MKIAVAVSGGADSLYALSVLKTAGHELSALYGRFASPRRDPLPGLREQCARLNIPLHVAELRETFRQRVIEPFVAAYAAGQTPNPCAHCNSAMKFGALLDMAADMGAERLATGHYADFAEHPAYGHALRRAADCRRDQSYFLALVPKERLARGVFPLAEVEKVSIPGKLAGQGLEAPLPEESREICFVPDDDYRAFLADYAEQLPVSGVMRLRDDRVVGQHEGLWRYTEGQRRGIGLAWRQPLYVLEKDCVRNSLILGTAAELRKQACRVGRLNVFVPPGQWPERVFVRIRHKQEARAADVTISGDGMHVRFREPQTACAPGQIACVYDEDGWVLSAGIIGAERS